MAYSEPYDALDEKTRDISRAITSLREELEAIDWYNQRVSTTKDPELKGIMAHNRDEELKTYLFVSGSVLEAETGAEDVAAPMSAMHIGNMKD